jgi:hypothetical protein
MKVLSRNEMKQLVGGLLDTGGGCQVENRGSYDRTLSADSLREARLMAADLGGHYCCASCCTATWADHTGC